MKKAAYPFRKLRKNRAANAHMEALNEKGEAFTLEAEGLLAIISNTKWTTSPVNYLWIIYHHSNANAS